MAVKGVAFQGVIECGSMAPAEASSRVLHLLGADGRYQVVQTGPSEIQFARRYRPTWAIVAAVVGALFLLVGLVFLFVTNTELCVATVDNDHRGTRLRLSGRLHAATLVALRESLRSGAGPAAPVPGAPVDALVASARSPRAPSGMIGAGPPVVNAQAPAQAMPISADPATTRSPAYVPAAAPSPSAPAAAAPARPGAAPQWLSSVPGPPAGAAGSTLVVDLTVGRPARPISRGVALLMDDGRRVPPGPLLLIGRDPEPAPAEEHASLLDVADSELTVSKTHLSVLHEGGQLVVVDRGSTNGSVVVGVDGRQRSLVPHQREVIVTGELVRFGDRSFRVVPATEERS